MSNQRLYYSINCFCYTSGKYEKRTKNLKPYVPQNSNKLYYIIDGDCKIFLDGAEYNLSKNQSFIQFSGKELQIEPINDNPTTVCWIEYGGRFADSLISQTSLTPDTPTVGTIDIPNFCSLFFEPDTNAKTLSEQLRTGSALINLFSYYVEYFPRIENQKSDYVDMAQKYIARHYADSTLSVAEIADHIKIDRSYLYTLIHRETGMSVIKLINRRRIAVAEALLLNGHHSIKDIALTVGFSDPMYFSKVFKKYNGLSPSGFRKKIRAEHQTE